MDKYKNHKNPLNRMGAKPLVRAFCFPRAHILFKAINLKTVSVATSSKGYQNFLCVCYN